MRDCRVECLDCNLFLKYLTLTQLRHLRDMPEVLGHLRDVCLPYLRAEASSHVAPSRLDLAAPVKGVQRLDPILHPVVAAMGLWMPQGIPMGQRSVWSRCRGLWT